MTFKIIEGDLFDPKHHFSALAQGVNCQGVMGAGIAPEFKKRWPDMFDEYRDLCQRYSGALAGTASVHQTPYSYSDERTYNDPLNGGLIYNLFTQVMPGPDATYRQLQSSLIQTVIMAEDNGNSSVGLPLIGGGLGGLAYHNILEIMQSVTLSSDVEFVLVERPNG